MNSPEIKEFIRQHSNLFWYTPEDKKEEISNEFLVETILNYGDMNDVRKLIKIIGIERLSEIFSGLQGRKIMNYYPEIYNFFSILIRRVTEQLNVTINDVKFTFYQYPFKINATEKLEDILRLPNLLDLAAMKAYAMGRRSKWKDYVDIYFILKDHFTIQQISERTSELFDQLFSEKLFRAQLSYFEDIDYSEPVEYLIQPIPEDEINIICYG